MLLRLFAGFAARIAQCRSVGVAMAWIQRQREMLGLNLPEEQKTGGEEQTNSLLGSLYSELVERNTRLPAMTP